MALAIDGSTPALATNAVASTATVTTASFTPPAGALLLVLWCGDTGAGVNPSAPSITDSLGTPLTYTRTDWQSHVDTPFVDGQAAIWWAVVGSSAAMTVTVTTGTASGAREAALRVVVITGQHATPIGAHGKAGSNSAASIAQSFTGTASSSWGFIVDCDWDTKGTQTAGTGCTILSAGTVTTAISYGFARRTTADGTNGGSTAMNVTIPGTSTGLNWCYVEVIPADATPPPVVANFTTAAVTAARVRAGRGQAILIRTPTGPVASTADATIPEVFGLTADATRAATADVTFTETFGLSVDATVTSAAPPPVVANFTAAASAAARGAFARAARPVALRAPTSGTAATADVTFTETFGLTVDATRAATADLSIGSTFGLTADATATTPSNPTPAAFDFTDSAAAAARVAYARSTPARIIRTPPAGTSSTGDVTLTETFGLSVTATRAAAADVTIAETFGLTVDASTGGASAQPSPYDFTDSAVTAALWYRSQVVEPVITRPPGVASSNATGDVTLAETFGLSVDATVSSNPAPAAYDFTDAAAVAARIAYARVARPVMVRAPSSGTAATVDVTITETFGLTTTAALGAAAVGTIPETFGLTTTATRNATAGALLAEVFTLTAAASFGAAAASTIPATFGLSVAALITTGFPPDGTAGPGDGVTIHAGPGDGIPVATVRTGRG